MKKNRKQTRKLKCAENGSKRWNFGLEHLTSVEKLLFLINLNVPLEKIYFKRDFELDAKS